MKHAKLIAILALALLLAACNGDAPDVDLSATADAASVRLQAARRAQTATAAAIVKTATAEARQTALAVQQTAQARDFLTATATAEARQTEHARAAYVAAMTATADALVIAQQRAQATATAEAQALTRARAIAVATADAANLERAQRQAEQDATLARRNADLLAVIVPLMVVVAFALIVRGAWLAYRQLLEARRLRYSILESRAGTIAFVRDGNTQTAQLLLPPGMPATHAADDYDSTQAAVVDAETFTVRTAQGLTVVEKADPQDAERSGQSEQETARRLAMRVLRAAMLQAGATANRIPPARDLGIPAALWVRAVATLKPHVATKQGRAGGTTLTGEFPTLASLYDAVGSRRLTPLSHGDGTAGG